MLMKRLLFAQSWGFSFADFLSSWLVFLSLVKAKHKVVKVREVGICPLRNIIVLATPKTMR